MFTFFQGTLLCALATNFEIVLASRILLGHAGASSMAAVPLYTSEISQPEVRTITGCFNVACTTLGVAISLLLGRYLWNCNTIPLYVRCASFTYFNRGLFAMEIRYWSYDNYSDSLLFHFALFTRLSFLVNLQRQRRRRQRILEETEGLQSSWNLRSGTFSNYQQFADAQKARRGRK